MRKLQEPYSNFVIADVNEKHVESNALNSWKLNNFDGRISFYCNNLDLLPLKPKFTFKHLKKGIQEFHRRFVLAQHMSITGLVRRLSLICIDAIWQLTLSCWLMRTIATFLHYSS